MFVAVAGGVIGVVGDIALGIMFVGAMLLAFAVVYWLLENARGFAAQLPLVAGLAVGAIDAVNTRLVSIMQSYEPTVTAWMVQIAKLFLAVFNYYAAPVLLPWFNALAFVVNRYIPDLYGNVVKLYGRADWAQDNIFNLSAVLFATDRHLDMVQMVQDYIVNVYVHDLYGNVVSLWNNVNLIQQHYVPDLYGNVEQLWRGLVELQAYLPLLRQLAGYEAGVAGALTGLGAQVGTLQQQGRVQGAQIESVLPLAGLAALSPAAIATLEALANDPCLCLNSGGFSDLPDRVSALEELGP